MTPTCVCVRGIRGSHREGLPQTGTEQKPGRLCMLTHQVKPGRVDVEYGCGPLHKVYGRHMDAALCTSPVGDSNFPGGGVCNHRAGSHTEVESPVGRSVRD